MSEETICQEELKKLKKTVRYDKMMAAIYSTALRITDWPVFLEETLQSFGKTLDVSRVYLFAYRSETGTLDNTFEWVAPDVIPKKVSLQNIPTNLIPWLTHALQNNEQIRLSNINQIPHEQDRTLFYELGIKSILAVPLFIGRHYYGFLGIDECRYFRDWEEIDVSNLQSLGLILTDKIERRRMDRVLLLEMEQQAARVSLSQKMEAIGMLTAGVAHEINTPIQYVRDNAYFLMKSLEQLIVLLKHYQTLAAQTRSKAEEVELLQKIETLEDELDIAYLIKEIPYAIKQSLEGVSKVNQLVSALKEFSHPGKKKKDFADLNRAIASTVTIARNEWKYVAELELDLEEGLPLVFCRVSEINQVVLNMIINAAHTIKEKASETNPSGPKGKIILRTRTLGNHVSIIIEDTGKGIPSVLLNKIFDPFFTTKDPGIGTGQGLAISREIILGKHGGQIYVESVEGLGTTFTVDLPIELLEVELFEREVGLV